MSSADKISVWIWPLLSILTTVSYSLEALEITPVSSEISMSKAELPLDSLNGPLRDSVTETPIPWSVEILFRELMELLDLNLCSLVETLDISAAGLTTPPLRPSLSVCSVLLPLGSDSAETDSPELLATEDLEAVSILLSVGGEACTLLCWSKDREVVGWILPASMIVSSGATLDNRETEGLVTTLLRKWWFDVFPLALEGGERWSRLRKLSDMDFLSIMSRIRVRRLWFWRIDLTYSSLFQISMKTRF